MFLVLLLYAMLAATFTLGKMLLAFLPPFFLISMRMIFSGIVLLSGYVIFSKNKRGIKSSDFFMLVIISLIHIFIPYATEYVAMERISPSSAALMYNLSPFFSAFFSYLYFSEKMTPLKWLGALISFSGLIYFAYPTSLRLGELGGSFFLCILLLFGVATSSLAWVIIRLFIKDKQYSIVCLNGISMLFGGIESLVASIAFQKKLNSLCPRRLCLYCFS